MENISEKTPTMKNPQKYAVNHRQYLQNIPMASNKCSTLISDAECDYYWRKNPILYGSPSRKNITMVRVTSKSNFISC